MFENIPLRKCQHAGLTIEGYSRAAVQTCWRIPELKCGFDLGVQPWDFMGTPTWFVSHTHLDHIAALAVYVSRRRMMKMDPPVIYLPANSIDHCLAMLRSFTRLDKGAMPCELLPAEPGDEIELSRELVVNVFPTRHTITSVGYMVSERRKKLKEEFQGLQGTEIRDLRMKGVEVSHETRMPILAYTGDTQPRGLDDNPEVFDCKILIAEMTFIAPDHRKEKIHKHGHMHLDDWVARKDRFNNELIIASHFSTRYSDQQIRRMVEKKLPGLLGGRLNLWL
ncbi:ribonuclease Z [Rosistilla oblonga]|uniref:MBL fold metallo-hydrolase n=1 Tax=Rosistilla oblonga TaxID=2527990 RepID=UPI00118AF36F|nr:MBL fold metallo-hydrolase [Rosistilla oblonga]QDV12580.1 ribonuclease Z [Rosistilla oblonga]